MKPSCKEFTSLIFGLDKLVITELNTINSITDYAGIINMEKDVSNFYNLQRMFEENCVEINRINAVDGAHDDVMKIYNDYSKRPYTKMEKNLGRKALASAGALGYLLTMEKVFTNAIKKNYEYILICDDDIGLAQGFIYKFDELIRIFPKFRILMLGSSQWNWDKVSYGYKHYIPTNASNGSFCTIYHRVTFDQILH